MPADRMIFVNLPVRDLKRSMGFFAELGFGFDARFTDDKAASMIVNEGAAYVMLLQEDFFKSFVPRELCDTATHTESLVCVSASSREEVDQLVKTALASGGSAAKEPMEMGPTMYGWSFYDPDGHHWEVMWMDASAIPPA